MSDFTIIRGEKKNGIGIVRIYQVIQRVSKDSQWRWHQGMTKLDLGKTPGSLALTPVYMDDNGYDISRITASIFGTWRTSQDSLC